MSQTENKMNIYQRINEVRKKIDYIRKEKAVQNYKAVTHDQVTAIVRQHLIDFGIVIVPSIKSSVTVDSCAKTSSGTPIIRVEAEYSFEFVNIDEPADRFCATVSAHANDTGDKAPGKALSYAKKALVLKVFEIESGDDEESRYAPEEPTTPYPEYESDVAKLKAIESIKELSLVWNKMDGKQKFYLEIVKEEQKVILANKEAKNKTVEA